MKMRKILSVATAIGLATFGLAFTANAEGFPPLAPLGPVPVPTDNVQTPEKIELGKILFFDSRIGGDASVSCADCHSPKQGLGFNDSLSRGYPGVIHWRNSQTVVNSAYLGKLFWAGAAKSLEAQAPSAAKGAVAGKPVRLVRRLASPKGSTKQACTTDFGHGRQCGKAHQPFSGWSESQLDPVVRLDV